MKRITLRLPDDVADKIEEISENADRSFNAEIIQALKYYIDMVRRIKRADKEFAKMKAGESDEQRTSL